MREECENNKPLFWPFCQRVARAASSRAKEYGVPFSINAYDIDRMFAEQKCCCAITGQPFSIPIPKKRQPFGPSLDRIVPGRGYVPSNVQLVTNMVNLAMSNWGEERFWEMIWWANTRPGKHITPLFENAA